MIRSLLVLLITLVVACSTPRPAPDNTKVRTGEETAKTAADAARDAESKDNTGLLVASSNDANEATTQPTTMPVEEPVEEPEASVMSAPILRVTFVRGTLTQAGEPISDFAKVCADAIAAEPKTVLVIEATPDTPQKKIMATIDAAKKAGIEQFSLNVEAPPTMDDAAPKKTEEQEAK